MCGGVQVGTPIQHCSERFVWPSGSSAVLSCCAAFSQLCALLLLMRLFATHCGTVCRGTQTMQNILTDLKAWMAPLQPETHHNGHLCKVGAKATCYWCLGVTGRSIS